MLSARRILSTGLSRVAGSLHQCSRMATTSALSNKLAIIGGGRMAEAILKSLMPTEDMSHVHVYDTNDSRLDVLKSKYGISKASNPEDAVEGADFVLFAVKPQHMQEVANAVKVGPDSWIISVMAGISMGALSKALKTENVVRCMPNTPAVVGEGMSVWTSLNSCPADVKKKVKNLLSMMGEELYVKDERYIDMATAVSGSGPAYVFLTMEAMIDAAVHMGFPRDVATRLTVHTLRGSATLALQSDEPLSVLRNNVTSPGGTTASALYALEKGGHRTVIADAIWAAYRRALELGDKNPNVGPGRNSY